MKLARCTYNGGAPFWGVIDLEHKEVNPIREAFTEWAPRVTAGAGISALSFSSGPLPSSRHTYTCWRTREKHIPAL
ncbi:MAG TPA: hypothetical protein EYN14_10045, partial [Alphaproteobacteria bacterium]|nr:hypothetical protein [Alphaproteobacteria bacterium]